MRKYSVSDIAGNEWLGFAKYTVEARAIPSMIDGLKPVQRFYLYSSIKNTAKDFKKVSAVSGIISDYGYNHAETSAAGAGALMAAEWNNHICLVEGRGSFGTRLVQEAGAPRYVYTRLHENFHKYIKDTDLAPAHDDPEHEPPKYYVPVIPLVLANGIRGIATGFATMILPRDPKALAKACQEYLKTGAIKKRVPVSFPEFNGKIEYDEKANRFLVRGTFVRKGKTGLTITEIPYGYDRETYVKILDALEDSDKIVSYEDCCDSGGFKFEVKLKATIKWTDAMIEREFKLIKTFTENLTVIDENGKLREYTDEREIIKDFCEFRKLVMLQRITRRVTETIETGRYATVKMEFINAVLNDKITFKGKNKAHVSEQILDVTSATEDDCERLLRIQMGAMTQEAVDALKAELVSLRKEFEYWNGTDEIEQFILDLEAL